MISHDHKDLAAGAPPLLRVRPEMVPALALYRLHSSGKGETVVTTPGLLSEAVADLHWLYEHDALEGVALIAAERRKQVERGDPAPTAYDAETELGFGNYAKAAALIAAELDQED